MYPSSSNGLNSETDAEVRFFTTAFHPLDNFSAHTVELWGEIFPTVEHAFHWKKFSTAHPDVAKRIVNAQSPEEAQRIARQNTAKIPSSWHDEKIAVMKDILTAKAAQHDDVRDALHRTGSRTIIENSPVDDFWGAGPHGNGQNMVGKLWMEVREEL